MIKQMQYPTDIRIAAEENAARLAHKELARAAVMLSDRYREEKGDGSRIVTDDCAAAAYAVVRMPATYAAVSAALGQALLHFGGEIRTMTDIGAGTGAGLFACSGLLEDLDDVLCLEREAAMRTLGQRLAEQTGCTPAARWQDYDMSSSGTLPRRSDLVCASYMLNEMPASERENALRRMWDGTEKLLLIIEPGTKKGYANILQTRKLLINLGAEIAAPCPCMSECPLPEDDWCHFTARVERSKLHKQLKGGDAPYEDEKFSYIAAVRGSCTGCERRILRHPDILSGVIGLHVCTQSGIADMKVTKKSPDFKKARKSSCGDEF